MHRRELRGRLWSGSCKEGGLSNQTNVGSALGGVAHSLGDVNCCDADEYGLDLVGDCLVG